MSPYSFFCVNHLYVLHPSPVGLAVLPHCVEVSAEGAVHEGQRGGGRRRVRRGLLLLLLLLGRAVGDPAGCGQVGIQSRLLNNSESTLTFLCFENDASKKNIYGSLRGKVDAFLFHLSLAVLLPRGDSAVPRADGDQAARAADGHRRLLLLQLHLLLQLQPPLLQSYLRLQPLLLQEGLPVPRPHVLGLAVVVLGVLAQGAEELQRMHSVMAERQNIKIYRDCTGMSRCGAPLLRRRGTQGKNPETR